MTFLRDLTNGTLLPDTFGRALSRGLAEQSVAFQVCTPITATTARYRIPIVNQDISATWVPEGDEIPLTDAEVGEIIVTPQKVAGLTTASREMIADASESVDRLFIDSVTRSLISAVDGAFFIDQDAVVGGEPPVKGIDFVDGIQEVDAGAAWANLDPFAEAISLASAQGATITSFVANPTTILALQKLKTATGANTPLLGADPAQPTKRTILGTQLHAYKGVANGVVYAISRDYAFAIQREGFTFESSKDAFFSSDRVAFKALTRVGFGFPFPEAHVKISLTEG